MSLSWDIACNKLRHGWVAGWVGGWLGGFRLRLRISKGWSISSTSPKQLIGTWPLYRYGCTASCKSVEMLSARTPPWGRPRFPPAGQCPSHSLSLSHKGGLHTHAHFSTLCRILRDSSLTPIANMLTRPCSRWICNTKHLLKIYYL